MLMVLSRSNGRPFWERHWRTALATLLLVCGFGYLLHAGGLPLFVPVSALRRVESVYLAGFLLGMTIQLILRFVRYHFLIAPIAHVALRRIIIINALCAALLTFLPFRLGEVARPAMLREKGRLSAWAVVGTVGAERILDGVLFSVVLLVGLSVAAPLSPAPDHIGALPVPASLVPQAARMASIVFGLAFLTMVAVYKYRSFVVRLVHSDAAGRWAAFVRNVGSALERTSEGFRFLVNPRSTTAYLAVSMAAIGIQVLALDLLAHSVGIPELTFIESMVVLGVLALGFSMPNAPGFFGAAQLSLYAGLAAYIAPAKVAAEGAVLVFIYYVTHLGLVSLFALIALVFEYSASRA